MRFTVMPIPSGRRAAAVVVAAVLAGVVALLSAAPRVHADSGGETISVSIPDSASTTPSTPVARGGGSAPGGLAWTGVDVLLPVAGGLVLVIGGAVLTSANRRRRRHG
jgi:hypothetical protein